MLPACIAVPGTRTASTECLFTIANVAPATREKTQKQFAKVLAHIDCCYLWGVQIGHRVFRRR